MATIKLSKHPFWNQIFRSIPTVTESEKKNLNKKPRRRTKSQPHYTLATSPRGSAIDIFFYFFIYSFVEGNTLTWAGKNWRIVAGDVIWREFKYITIVQIFWLGDWYQGYPRLKFWRRSEAAAIFSVQFEACFDTNRTGSHISAYWIPVFLVLEGWLACTRC